MKSVRLFFALGSARRLVILGVAALLLEPVVAHGTSIVVLALSLHGPDRAIGEQGGGNRDETDDEQGHHSIMRHS